MKSLWPYILIIAASSSFAENGLVIKSNPSDAKIYVDGVDMGKTTPSSLDSLKSDSKIILKKDCYEDFVFTKTILKNKGTARLVPVSDIKCANAGEVISAVVVKSNPSGAKIFLAGEDIGLETPSRLKSVSPKAVIVLRKEGYRECTIPGIKQPSVSCDLQKAKVRPNM